MPKIQLEPGLYEAQTDVNIRREPKVVEYKVGNKFITNRVGAINVGTRRMIYSLITKENGETWGRVSEADSAGIAEWVIVQNLNRTFMSSVELPGPVVVPQPSDDFDERLDRLEEWAKTKGFEIK